MIDPMLSLAFTVHANPGVYALMLGSGISRTSGIPTGWEIVLDLVGKLAALRGEKCEPDEETWYRNAFKAEPNYSILLDELAKTPAERKNLLYPYFQPTAEEREQGRKMPTPAHRAIAELVSLGYFRVILTTNFDTLIEDALRDAGVTPYIVRHSSDIAGAPPLSHVGCLVVKLHGDYLDTRILNTPEELEIYADNQNDLLDRVVDEFGLIVCGWSAEWDTALRDAMARCKNRRYMTYWATVGTPRRDAQNLIDLRGGQVMTIAGADPFFRELAGKVAALRDIDQPHPLTGPMAAAQVKRYIADPQSQIRLHDLVVEETERLYKIVTDPNVPPGGVHVAPDAQRQIEAFEAASGVMATIMAHGCYWGDQEHRNLWTRSLERIGSPFDVLAISSETWHEHRHYPAALLFYAGGIAAMASGRHDTVASLLRTRCRDFRDNAHPAAKVLTYYYLSNERAYYPPTPDVNTKVPISSSLYYVLREPLRSLLPEDRLYDHHFNQFECLLFLVAADIMREESWQYVPVGRFALDLLLVHMGKPHPVLDVFDKEVKRLGDKWPYFQAGFFGKSQERYQAARTKINNTLKAL